MNIHSIIRFFGENVIIPNMIGHVSGNVALGSIGKRSVNNIPGHISSKLFPLTSEDKRMGY